MHRCPPLCAACAERCREQRILVALLDAPYEPTPIAALTNGRGRTLTWEHGIERRAS